MYRFICRHCSLVAGYLIRVCFIRYSQAHNARKHKEKHKKLTLSIYGPFWKFLGLIDWIFSYAFFFRLFCSPACSISCIFLAHMRDYSGMQYINRSTTENPNHSNLRSEKKSFNAFGYIRVFVLIKKTENVKRRRHSRASRERHVNTLVLSDWRATPELGKRRIMRNSSTSNNEKNLTNNIDYVKLMTTISR